MAFDEVCGGPAHHTHDASQFLAFDALRLEQKALHYNFQLASEVASAKPLRKRNQQTMEKFILIWKERVNGGKIREIPLSMDDFHSHGL